MAAASSLPYRLRPNKAVDRELFLCLLTRLASGLGLERYQYIGLGGPFLEDFRLVHARLGIQSMICIESMEAVHRRQVFNRPVECIKCVHSKLEDFIDANEFCEPLILWLDFTDPNDLAAQIELFSRSIGSVAVGSILRITLNANPSSLGEPDSRELGIKLAGFSLSLSTKPTLQEWRLSRFKKRLGSLFPSGLLPEGMTHKNFGKSVLHALRLSVAKEALSLTDRNVEWALCCHYSDGQPMVTATVLITKSESDPIANTLRTWEFYSTPKEPLLLDMPALSTLERLTMEAAPDPKSSLGFDLPVSDMKVDPITSFKRFYRVFPHFSRVEL